MGSCKGLGPKVKVTKIGIYKGSLKGSVRVPLRVWGLRVKLVLFPYYGNLN